MKLCGDCLELCSKMYCLSSVCFMCLNDKDIVNYIILQHTKNEIVQQVRFILPEIVVVEPDLPLPVCSACCKALLIFQNFKKMCLGNICLYNNYIHKLQGPSGSSRQKYGELEVKIGENILLSNFKKVKYTDSNIEELETEDNLIDIEEFSVLEGNTDLFSQQILKKDSARNLQECDENINCADQIIKNEIEDQEIRINENKLITNLKQGENKVSSMEKLDESTGTLVYQQVLKQETIPKNAQNCRTTNFKCSICNKVLVYKSQLIAHMKVHTDEKDFKCSKCNKMYARKRDLERHILTTHTKVKNYKCSVCNKRFSLKHYLQSHMSVHTGKKNYKCSVCNKLFSRKTGLGRHILATHIRVKEFQCFLCNKKFALKEYLTSHIKRHMINNLETKESKN